MKKKLLAAAAVFMAYTAPAMAYDVVNLPETMPFSEALGVYEVSDITDITISELNDDMYVQLSQDEIKDFYYSVQNTTLTRRINPTPFRGINVTVTTDDGKAHSFNLSSGVQIGKFGKNNYVCYTMSDTDMADYMYLSSLYYETETKLPGAPVSVSEDYDFLKLPEDPWAVEPVKEAASRSLIPYELTNNYGAYISREDFCKLLGNFIAVKGGYASIEDYMKYNGLHYDDGAFADCVGRDKSICILYALGIVNGKGGVMFEPDACLTREEAAKLLTETAAKFRHIDTRYRINYSDRRQIAPWAEFYVRWVTDCGIMSGIDKDNFAPKDYYTRQQAIATVTRLFNVC